MSKRVRERQGERGKHTKGHNHIGLIGAGSPACCVCRGFLGNHRCRQCLPTVLPREQGLFFAGEIRE